MAEVPLTQGKVALVDDEDYEYLSQFKWYAQKSETTWYAARHPTKNKTVRMHRVLMDDPQGLEVDHEDRDGLNNQRYNLRVATHAQNGRNRRPHTNKTSGYKGVYWQKASGRWIVQIQLGSYDTAEEAARMYDEAARRYHGEFAYLNFPEEIS
jgi:hypothetical protein